MERDCFAHGGEVLRRRRRRRQREEAVFENINITPFTDVLLVLLIIFLIAGSSFSRSGLQVDRLATATSERVGESEEQSYTLVVDDVGELFLLQGEERQSVDPARLETERSVYLTAEWTTETQKVAEVYDRLLQLRFTKVYLTAPLARVAP